METYNGHVRTPTDAIILFEACRLGILPRVQRRLSEKERQSIRSGSVFVWDEREAGMRRWTDGKSWSASRVSGSFLTYREMEGKRGGNSFVQPAGKGTKTPDNAAPDGPPQDPDGEEGPDGYRYKPDGLMKQSFSITTSQGQHLHLISYYSRSHPTAQGLRQPSTDPALASIVPAKGLYPESTINDQSSVPVVTRSPMVGVPGYAVSPSTPGYHRPSPQTSQPYLPPGYLQHAAYVYPISPVHTPPGHPGHYPVQMQPYTTMPPGLPPIPYPSGPYQQHPLHHHMNQAPPSSYDQRPLRTSESAPPPPPPPLSAGPPQGPPTPYSHAQSLPPPSLQQQQQQPSPAAYEDDQKLQIDPRLTAAVETAEQQQQQQQQNEQNGASQPAEDGQGQPEYRPEYRTAEQPHVNASQAPTINSLVHSISTLPPVETRSQNEIEQDRQGSTSPGGTKNGAPPQDIPSEKLGFREDKRVLSKLDRVFARV
ncbi:Gluconate transport-inducing protein [Exophiala sideris]|uniref:Gluconate transport-inducing protein n=1 Tax=Exophiala sideris TaxID=1016849 RepID=A0ABR0JG44_9EURO|nr:Gluconate transport-inducing protein [Exophiala sideris]